MGNCFEILLYGYRLSVGVPTEQLKSISDHPSFHGKLPGKIAAAELRRSFRRDGSAHYLTRYSEKKEHYILSVIQQTKNDTLIRHYKLNINRHAYDNHRIITEIEGTEEQFDSIFDLLAFYERNPVDHEIVGIGQCIIDINRQFSRYFEEPPSTQWAGMAGSNKTITGAEGLGRALDRRFTLAEIKLIKWADEKGNIKKFKLSERVSSTWKDMATLLGMEMDKITNYEQITRDNVRRFEYVASEWIDNYANHRSYPATWRGLLELLKDLERSIAADNLSRALLNKN